MIQPSTRVKILIVEDDADLVATYTDLLELHNYSVTCISSANKAIDLVKELKPNLVFLDLQLSGYPGTILIRVIRDYEPLKDTKLIVITGHPEILDHHRDTSRIDLILTKPVSNEKLLQTVEQFTLQSS